MEERERRNEVIVISKIKKKYKFPLSTGFHVFNYIDTAYMDACTHMHDHVCTHIGGVSFF